MLRVGSQKNRQCLCTYCSEMKCDITDGHSVHVFGAIVIKVNIKCVNKKQGPRRRSLQGLVSMTFL